jgi:hypothetical protein
MKNPSRYVALRAMKNPSRYVALRAMENPSRYVALRDGLRQSGSALRAGVYCGG